MSVTFVSKIFLPSLDKAPLNSTTSKFPSFAIFVIIEKTSKSRNISSLSREKIYFPFDENELACSLTYANGTGFQTEYAIVETVNNANNELKIVNNEIMDNVKDNYMIFYYNAWENDDAEPSFESS